MRAWKTFWFEASHTLPDNPQTHGHSYQVKLWFETNPVQPVELNQIEKLLWQLHRYVDHRHLNDFIKNPTMEGISEAIFNQGQVIIKNQEIRLNLLAVDVERPSLNFGVQA